MEQNVKTIAFACDHGGYLIKDAVINHLQKKGYEVIDFGTNSSESVDYPVYAEPCCRSIVAGKADLGILICGTGIGMSIAANKIHGIRAACCGDTYSAAMTRNHNNANVLCLGARVVGEGLALEIIDAFLANSFVGSYHTRRVEMLAEIEKKG